MNEKEFYDLVCKGRFDDINKRFDKIDGKQAEILDVLKGKDGDPGLCDKVRDIQKFHKRIIAVFISIISIFSVQFAIWLRQKLTGG